MAPGVVSTTTKVNVKASTVFGSINYKYTHEIAVDIKPDIANEVVYTQTSC